MTKAKSFQNKYSWLPQNWRSKIQILIKDNSICWVSIASVFTVLQGAWFENETVKQVMLWAEYFCFGVVLEVEVQQAMLLIGMVVGVKTEE